MNELAKKDLAMNGGLVQFQMASDALFFADQVFRSGLAPASFKSAQAIFVAVQQGAELGLKPMQALQGICVVNGRTALMEKCARGLALSSGSLESIEERFEGSGDDFTAICVVRRKSLQNTITGRFSVADAKKACLWNKAGPWTNYPKDMLAKKASTRALNGAFSDVLIGLPIFEDIQDTPPEKIATINPNPVNDPLLNQVAGPTIRKLMEEKSRNPMCENPITPFVDKLSGNITNDQKATARSPMGDERELDLSNAPMDDPASEPLEIHPDDLDCQNSQAETTQAIVGTVQPLPEKTQGEGQSGANEVEARGPLDVVAPKIPDDPKKKPGPWNVTIGGIKMAVWKRSLPKIVEWLEKGNRGMGKNWRANYTTGVGPKYTNHTMVSLEIIE